ncbi:hypothetical protein QQ045_008607 [Rhodiola kirilowii]
MVKKPHLLWCLESYLLTIARMEWDERCSTFRWKFSSNGDYTVKSAYEMLKANLVNVNAGGGEQSNKSQMNIIWRKKWSARVPNKVKIFCWRLYYNSLSNACNLEKRGVDVDSRCKICGMLGELAAHVIRDCGWANDVAFKLGLDMSLYSQMTNEKFMVFLVATWICWKNRNKVCHEQESWGVERAVIVGKSMLRLAELFYCLNPLENADMSGVWSPPDAEYVKVNSDGSWDLSSKDARIGVIARDHQGTNLWAYSDWMDSCTCPNDLEDRALLKGLEHALKLDITMAIFETDSLEVYKVVSIGVG